MTTYSNLFNTNATSQQLANQLDNDFISAGVMSRAIVGKQWEDLFEGSSLDPNWTENGSITVTVEDGYAKVLAGASTGFNSKIFYDKTFVSNRYYSELTYKVNNTSGSDFGVGIGLAHPNGRKFTCRFTHSGGEIRTFYNEQNTSPVNIPTVGKLTLPVQNDIIKLRLEVNRNNLKTTVQKNGEIVLQQLIEMEFDFVTNPPSTSFTPPNLIQPAVYFFNNTDVWLESIEAGSMYNASNQVVFVGDSHFQGFDAGALNDTISELVADKLNLNAYAVMSSAGSTTAQLIEALDDINEHNSNVHLLLIGQNDISASVPVATIQTNIEAIVNSIEGAGGTVKILTNYPTGDPDTATLNAWIRTTYTTDVIDVFKALADASDNLNATYGASGHLNDTGQRFVAEIIANYILQNNLL